MWHVRFWYIISNSFNFSWVLIIVAILMMSAKSATPGVLKISAFWNKAYDVIVSVHDVSSKFSWFELY